MRILSLPRTHAPAVLLALAAGLVGLSGCGADDLGDKLAEKAVEQAADGEDVDVDIDSDSDQVKIETSDGTFSAGQGLPEDFPDDVPLVEGEVLSAMSQSGAGYVVTVQTGAASAEDAMAAAGDLLTGAGYAQGEGSMQMEGMSIAMWTGPWDVTVASVDDTSGTIVLQYTVTTPTQ